MGNENCFELAGGSRYRVFELWELIELLIVYLNPHLLMEHDSQFKVSKEIVSVAQITTGSSLSPSIPKFFYNGQISPENRSNKHVKVHSITVFAEMPTSGDLKCSFLGSSNYRKIVINPANQKGFGG